MTQSNIDPLPPWLDFPFANLEELLGFLAQGIQAERRATWVICDLCAWARAHAPHDRALVKTLASTLGVSSQTVRRYIQTGMTYAPDLRAEDRPLTLFYEALRAENPTAVIQLALTNAWSPRQLREYVRGDSNPPMRLELFHVNLAGTPGEPIEEQAIERLLTMLARALRDARPGLTGLNVRAVGTYPAAE